MRGCGFLIVTAGLFVASVGQSFAAVKDDATTEPPELVAPTTDSLNGLPIGISYTLPEVPLSGSVILTFAGVGGNTVLTLGDSQVVTFAWDGAGPSAPEIVSTQGPALADGTYSVTLSYQDFLANPAASDAATNVVIDTGGSTTTTTFVVTTTSLSTTTTLVTTTTTLASTTTTLPVTTTTGPAVTTTVTTTTSTTIATTSTTTTTVPSGCGDPFNPGSITAGDALFVLRAAVGLETCEDCICDINGSGGTNTTDSLQLLRIAQGLEGVLACPPCDG